MGAIIDIALVPGAVAECDGTAPVELLRRGEALAEMGGECVFLGRTRSERRPALGELLELEYEVYSPMAERRLEAVAREAALSHECGFVGIRHSAGVVPVGAVSVSVRVLARHRAGAFEACREIIDRLKREVPIWKRERWERGETWQEGLAGVHRAEKQSEGGS